MGEVIKVRVKTCKRCGLRFETKGRYARICEECNKTNLNLLKKRLKSQTLNYEVKGTVGKRQLKHKCDICNKFCLGNEINICFGRKICNGCKRGKNEKEN